jgi:hypothetical protein
MEPLAGESTDSGAGGYYAGREPPSKRARYFRYTMAALFFIFIFVTVSLSLGHAIGNSRPAFFIIGASLLILSVIVGMQLNWMRQEKFDALPRAKYATLGLCLAMMALSSGVLAIVYDQPADLYSVGGSAQNVQSSFVLSNADDGEDLTVQSGTCLPFSFVTKLESGSHYNIQMKTPPTSGDCQISGGTGTVSGKDVNSVRITCTVTYSVGGRVSGLKGSSPVVLSLNDDSRGQSVDADGTFTFDTKLQNGATWNVRVLTQPSGQACTFSGATSGTINGADVTSLSLNCT